MDSTPSRKVVKSADLVWIRTFQRHVQGRTTGHFRY
ncbi:hypothetical protein FsymDg_4237 [Candidatus Protofrankia datiscae]|uniref:Uncharacterized protein n=1 Tax=Candidatus Protofrankia datiscae TaxID=2716812 RepID=F8AXT0_9ACTN|nr:hypothetical protein FsymDg_4237 [Candidatus Protofrankia datiscae]